MKYDIMIIDENGEECVKATVGTDQPFDEKLAGLLFVKAAGMCDPQAIAIGYLHQQGIRTVDTEVADG